MSLSFAVKNERDGIIYNSVFGLPFLRSLLHWPIQQAAMANTADCIGHHSQLCEKGQF